MKKWMAFALVLAMALSLCACGEKIDEETQKKLDLYDEYEDFIEMLEDEEYEELIRELAELYQEQQGGSEDPEDPEDPDVPDVPAEPTQAEQNALLQYYEIVYALHYGNSWVSEYDENGDYVRDYSDQEALRFCYEKLQVLTVADQWTQWCRDRWGEEFNWDRMEQLGNFSVLTDVPLSQKWTTVDHMDNQYGDSTSWTYWADGTIAYSNHMGSAFEIIESDPWNLRTYNTCDYTYDDAGRVTQIKYGSEDYTEYLVTLTYDAAGNKVGEHIKSNSGECDFTYSYDDRNRLVQLEYPCYFSSTEVMTVTYTYDAAGNVVKEERVVHYYNAWVEADVVSAKEITEYTYDAGGKLVSGVYTKESWGYNYEYDSSVERWVLTEQYMDTQRQDQYAFTCDDQGRPLTLVITYGDEYYVYGDNAGQISGTANDVSRTYEFLYGDYYFYNAE